MFIQVVISRPTMIPSHRNHPEPVSPTVDRQITVYVLLTGVAGGLILAVVVMVCCKVCLRKKKLLTRALPEFDPDDLLESGLSHSWAPTILERGGTDDFNVDFELREKPKARAPNLDLVEETQLPEEAPDAPERAPEPTSVVRRRSSVGIQRQASVCLSDEEDQIFDNHRMESESTAYLKKLTGQKEITRVSAIVHRSYNGQAPALHHWDPSSIGVLDAKPLMEVHPPPFISSQSIPDSESTLDLKHVPVPNTVSLHGITPTLAHVVDLEDYHYSRKQVWELTHQGAALLKDKSQSNLDVAGLPEGGIDEHSPIQQAASTEAGLLEKSLDKHQLNNLDVLLKTYSLVDEEDRQILSKVRYNDTGSREDIREEVIEMISGESSEDSNCSVESQLLKQESRQIWELRATLEEEVDLLSDTQDISLDDILDMPDKTTVQATASFEWNVDRSCDYPSGYECDESDYLELPSHELRRHCYKSILNKRLRKVTPGTESSYDSWDSLSTERTEGASTSFDSTTDNTDSTGEGQTNRLQQMKADSGYKSMESNGKAPRLGRKHLQFTLEGESVDRMNTMEGTFEEEVDRLFQTFEVPITDTIKTKSAMESFKVVSFEGVSMEGVGFPSNEPLVHQKKSKSALKKYCMESDLQWSDAFLEVATSETRGKTSVFQKIFRTGRLKLEELQQFRDYSIDEKSDTLFREFSRHDSETENFSIRGPRLHGQMKLHHRSLPSAEVISPHLPKNLMSPHVSIEEESGENGEEVAKKSGRSDEQLEHSNISPTQISVICFSNTHDGI